MKRFKKGAKGENPFAKRTDGPEGEGGEGASKQAPRKAMRGGKHSGKRGRHKAARR